MLKKYQIKLSMESLILAQDERWRSMLNNNGLQPQLVQVTVSKQHLERTTRWATSHVTESKTAKLRSYA
jgi:hypothetical protein